MGAENIIGIQVHHCQRRKGRRAFYYSGKWPGWDEGSTLLCIQEGRAVFNIWGKTFTAGKNDIVLWDPGGLKELRPYPDTPVSYYAMTFDLYTLSGEAANVLRLGLPSLIRGRQPRIVWALIKEIYAIYDKKRRYYMNECAILGLKLMRTLHETCAGRHVRFEDPGPFMDNRIRETLTYIAENYKTKLKVKTLAARAGLQPAHYTRLFRKIMGATPYQYLLNRKIEKAMDFIRLHDDDPPAVSLEFGFHDYAHFYRTFRQRAGMSPSQYMKRFKKK
jgi:AraC-like DNA-binding protein